MTFFVQPRFITIAIYTSQMSDAGGLFMGRMYGKTPFAHTISPSKTWEGVYGAIGFSVLTGFIFKGLNMISGGYLSLDLPIFDYIMLGFI